MVSKKFCEARCPIININAHFLEISTQLSKTVPDFEILPNNWESRDSETVLTFKFCPIRSRNIDFTTHQVKNKMGPFLKTTLYSTNIDDWPRIIPDNETDCEWFVGALRSSLSWAILTIHIHMILILLKLIWLIMARIMSSAIFL